MDCIFNVYKDPGTVSFNVIRYIRKRFNIRKCGYTGTLDPFASGVLPVFTGNFTKLIPFLNSAVKTYRFRVKWGYRTDTLDITGNEVKREPVQYIDAKSIEDAVNEHFTGEFMQTPPSFSAVKINGRHAYDYARSGEHVNIRPRRTSIHRFEIISTGKDGFSGIIDVPRGFYVRSFTDDLAGKLNTLGTLEELERLADGPFKSDNAVLLGRLMETDTTAVEYVMKDFMKIMKIDETQMNKLKNGQSLVMENYDQGKYLMMNSNSIVIAELMNGLMRPVRGIR